jgi:hypothetical protein
MYFARDESTYNQIAGVDLNQFVKKKSKIVRIENLPVDEIKYKALSHQKSALMCDKKNIFLGGGVGCGKTDTGSVWTRRKVNSTPPDVVGMIVANSYSQLIDSTLRNMYKNFNNWGLDVLPETLPRGHKPFSIKIWNGIQGHWVEILCRSLDSYQLLSGTEVGWVWVDECWMTKKEAIDVLVARLRDDRMGVEEIPYKSGTIKIPGNQILYTTTLDEPDTWMYELFVENFDPTEMEVFYATTYDNEVNLPAGYIDTLKAMYTKQMFARMVMSKWVSASEHLIYHAFDRKLHESTRAEFDDNLPIIWTHDFNIGVDKPMSSALGQLKKGRHVIDVNKETGKVNYIVRPEVHWFDEIVIDTADTNDIVNEFKSRQWYKEAQRKNLPIIIYGDASGKSRDTRSKTTDYKILQDAGFTDQRQPLANPRIRDRHNSVNAMLQNALGDVRTKIHPRCKTIIRGLETTHLKPGAQYLEVETKSQHVTTAIGYYYAKEWPIEKPQIISQGVG